MRQISHLITILAAATALTVLSGCHRAPPLPREGSPTTAAQQTALTPDEALRALREGNARFVAGTPLHRDTRADVRATTAGQYPFAVVLSCLDSRQPIELVLDQGIGDIFSARVAGNVLNEDILGSMEFAAKVVGVKLIAVIGHTSCGAVKGAIDNAKLGNLTGLLAKIKPAATNVSAAAVSPTSTNEAFVDDIAAQNVRLVMSQVRSRSPVLDEMLATGQIKLVGGMYDLHTGRIDFFE